MMHPPAIDGHAEFEEWRTSLSAAMLESTVEAASERHPGLARLLAHIDATLDGELPPDRPTGWLITGTPLSADAVRVIAARHATLREGARIPVVHLTLDDGDTLTDVANRLVRTVGPAPTPPGKGRRGGRSPFEMAHDAMVAAGTSMVVIDRIDRVVVDAKLSDNLRHLAAGRALVAMRPDEHQGVKVGPFGNTDRATVSGLGLWMARVDLRDLDDEALSDF